jgi:hypothetical protein
VVSSGSAGLEQEGSPEMSRNIVFILAILVGMASSVFAETPQPAPAAVGSPSDSSRGVSIVLEMRWLLLNDANLTEFFGPKREQLVKWGAPAVIDKQQIERMLMLASGDKRSSVYPTQTVAVPNGEKSEFWLVRSGQRNKTTVLATVSDDRRAIQIDWTWPKREDGGDSLPETTTRIPMGSNLLIHTHVLSESRLMPPVSLWQRFQDVVFHGNRATRATAVRKIEQGFLLVSPRIALPGEKEAQMVAK